MKGKNKAAREAARQAKRAGGKPLVSKYAAKGGPVRYEFQERQEDARRRRW